MFISYISYLTLINKFPLCLGCWLSNEGVPLSAGDWVSQRVRPSWKHKLWIRSLFSRLRRRPPDKPQLFSIRRVAWERTHYDMMRFLTLLICFYLNITDCGVDTNTRCNSAHSTTQYQTFQSSLLVI